MQLDEIFELWAEDARINNDDLDNEAANVPYLHHKYYKILSTERMRLKALEEETKKLKLAKYEFFSQGPSAETKDLGWEYPAKGVVIKTEIPMYMDADKEIQKNTLKLALQREVVEVLESIINMIVYRNQSIGNAIQFIKFTNGVG